MQRNLSERSSVEVHVDDNFPHLEADIAGGRLKILVLVCVKLVAHHVPMEDVQLLMQLLA